MGKFKPKKFIATVFLSSVVILAIFAIVDADSEFGFNIPPPQLTIFKTSTGGEFSDFDDPRVIGSVACWVKSEMQVKDKFGLIRGTEKSDFLKLNPTHVISTQLNSLVDEETGITIDEGKYLMTPSIKCNANEVQINSQGSFNIGDGIDAKASEEKIFSDFLGFPLSLEQPLVIYENDMRARIYAHYPDGTIEDVFNGKFKVERQDIINTESHNLGELEVDPLLALKFLNEGTYVSTHEFAIEGFIIAGWAETETCQQVCTDQRFVIPIETKKTTNSNGFVTSVNNPIMVQRVIEVENGEGEPKSEDIPPVVCGSNQVLVGETCVTQGTTPPPVPPTDPITEIFGSLTTCLASGDPSCLANGQFIGLYLGGFGLILLLGAVAQGGKKDSEIYGVPTY